MVVRCRNFTQAAEQCTISQSAISQQIQALEAELGAVLIDRGKRRFVLTKAGEYFYKGSLSITQELDVLRQTTMRIAHGEDHLTVGYVRSYDGTELQEAMADYASSHPDRVVDFIPASHEILYGLLKDGKVDMVMNDIRRTFSTQYVHFSLGCRPCMIEVSPQNTLASHNYLTGEDLASFSCIVIAEKDMEEEEGAYYHDILGLGKGLLFAQSLEEARLLVAANRGFLHLACSSGKMVRTPQIKRLPFVLHDKPVFCQYGLFWRVRNTAKGITEFADCLKAVFSSTMNC